MPVESIDTQTLTSLVKKEETEKLEVVDTTFYDDPYPDMTPTQMLSKRFWVGSFDASNDDQFLVPLQLWAALPSVGRYLSRFGLFKCDWEIDFEMVSTPFWFGVVGISALPYQDQSGKFIKLQQQIQSDMILLDVNLQHSCKLQLPYLRPQTFYENKSSFQNDWRIGIHQFFASDINTAAAISIKFDVFVTAKNIQTAGLLTTDGHFHSIVPRQEFQVPIATNRLSRVLQATALGGTVIHTLMSKFAGGWRPDTVAQNLASQGAADALKRAAQGIKEFRKGKSDPENSNTEKPVDNVKMDLFGDICSPTVTTITTATHLGDDRGFLNMMPLSNEETSLAAICGRPSLVATKSYTTPGDSINFNGNPFIAGSHTEYMARCFKYWRGSTRFMVCFYTSSLVSARFRITIYPMGYVAAGDPMGDLPSWVVSVKGSTCVNIEVPYLNTTMWADVHFLPPAQVRVELMDAIAGPTEQSKFIYSLIFGASAPDVAFAGYQSFYPGKFNGIESDLHSTYEGFASNNFPTFQGGLIDVNECISRFSSRAPNPEYRFPFPIAMTQENFVDLDNFDYLTNLYGFYSGENHVKMLFANAPVSDILQTTIQNSSQDVHGADFKASNGIVATAQAVWPLLEVVFPYLNTVPYNSVHFPLGAYAHEISAMDQLKSYMIAKTSNFSLSYLLPVPDIDFDVYPEEEGEFHGRVDFTNTYTIGLTCASGGPYYVNQELFTGETGYFRAHYNVSVYRTTGSNDTDFAIEFRKTPRTENIDFSTLESDPDILFSIPSRWSDSGAGADIYSFSGSFVSETSDKVYATFAINGATPTGTFRGLVSTSVTGLGDIVAPYNSSTTDPIMAANITSAVFVSQVPDTSFTVSISGSVDVDTTTPLSCSITDGTLTSITNTVNCSLVGGTLTSVTDPLHAIVDSGVLTSITDDVNVVVTNSIPIDPGSVVTVQGTLDDPIPVRTTLY